MSELQVILNAIATCQKIGEPMFLATVVNTKGSTYRRPGARMLMTSAGQIVGAISGGCLENDVYSYTRQCMSSGKPIVVTYDTAADVDLVWGFGIGCNGVVQVLIERLDIERSCNQIDFLRQCCHTKQPGVLVTVFGVEGAATKISIGSRLMLSGGQIISDIDDLTLISLITQDANAALHNQQSIVKRYQWSAGWAEVLIEVIQPPTPLMIFGAGRDAIPVAHFAKALGWDVTIVDCRASEATQARFAIADQVILTRREILSKQVSIDENTIAAIMTHNYFDDLETLKMLLPSPVRYIGVLGSRDRTERLLNELLLEGPIYTNEQLNRLYAPIGIDIGADTPEAIALAIISEIQMVLTNRSGRSLKDCKEPIHEQIRQAAQTNTACVDGTLMDV